MKKHFLFLLLAMIGISLQSIAQKIDLKNVKFIKVTADGVNMRKAPNTKSAKLMMISLNGAEGCDSRATPTWSAKKTKGYSLSPASPMKGEVLPVIGETEEWYHAIYWDFGCGNFYVYINKQFCKEATMEKWDYDGSYDTIKSGTHKGWVIIDNSDPENGDELIAGHLVNGMMVFDYSCTNPWGVDKENLSTAQFKEHFKKRNPALVQCRVNGNTTSFNME